jgi:peroxiredoxin
MRVMWFGVWFAAVGCAPTPLAKPAADDARWDDDVDITLSDDEDVDIDDAADEEPDQDVDSDGDGVFDRIEIAFGSDPNDPDTDGDGFDDGEEVDANTNPMSSSDHPYAGGWAIDACRNDLDVSGDRVGQVTANFALLDQHGETVRLHDFCGRAVMLVASAMWCGPCQSEAGHLAEVYRDYAEDGFIVITLLGEDSGGATPNEADLREWADAFGIEHPVVADPGFGVAARFVTGSSISLPSTSLLGEGAVVVARDSWISDGDIRAALP